MRLLDHPPDRALFLLHQYLEMVKCIQTGDEQRMALTIQQFAGASDIDQVREQVPWCLTMSA